MVEKNFNKNQFIFSIVRLNKYFQNIYGAEHHSYGVIFPKSKKDVEKLVLLARRYKIPLYPISTGKNYGLGSKIPVLRSHVVIDLKRMNRISNFHSSLGTIRIEPGVTQKQLYEFLIHKRAKFELNVTGSASDSSILGNTLERGIGHYGPRAKDLLSLQVVLGTGKTLETGADVYAERSAVVSRFGIGADLTQVFTQSSFGIVTGAKIKLRPSSSDVTFLNFHQDKSQTTSAFIDELMELRRVKLIPSNLHISNFNRRVSVLAPLVARKTSQSFEASKKKVEAKISMGLTASASLSVDPDVSLANIKKIESKKIRSEFSARSLESVLSATDIFSQSTKGTILHAKGVPCSDSLLSIGYGQNELVTKRLEESTSGTLFLVPAIPATGNDVQKAIKIIEREFLKENFVAYITLNLVDDLFFEAVVNLTFKKTDKVRTKQAHKTVQRSLQALNMQGYFPQRLSIFQMSDFQDVKEAHKNAICGLKHLFDPDSILSCGRYEFGSAK